MAETLKSQARREREGFFEFCKGRGLDVGAGDDPLVTPFGTVDAYDKQDGDANYLKSVADESYDFVYSSHCLEHLDFPHIALQNWFRVVKKGGYLIVCVPHRDLYEKKRMLPSLWNAEHKSFWLPNESDPPHTFSLREFIERWIPNAEIIAMNVCDEGKTNVPTNVHSTGEYQIECILRK